MCQESKNNTEICLVRIQPECGKMRARKNSVFGHLSRSESFNFWILKSSKFKKLLELGFLSNKNLVVFFS